VWCACRTWMRGAVIGWLKGGQGEKGRAVKRPGWVRVCLSVLFWVS
jgi:hypothetical protein